MVMSANQRAKLQPRATPTTKGIPNLQGAAVDAEGEGGAIANSDGILRCCEVYLLSLTIDAQSQNIFKRQIELPSGTEVLEHVMVDTSGQLIMRSDTQ
jgi:hypothetical protein